MKNCANCEHLYSIDICCFCGIVGREISFPRLMGGPKKCECYEKSVKVKRNFKYPQKEGKRMRTMTETEKSEMACRVWIRLTYRNNDDVPYRFSKLEDCLKEKGLTPEISNGSCSDEYLILTCDGTISLLDAEKIMAKSDTYMLSVVIRYYPDKGFVLTQD